MKKLLLLSFFIFNLSFSQEVETITYKFLNPESVQNISDYKLAFSTADMSAFRYENKNNIIEFQSGLKVELFSINKLRNVNSKLSLQNYKTVDEKPSDDYYFTLSANKKFILQKFTRTEFKKLERQIK